MTYQQRNRRTLPISSNPEVRLTSLIIPEYYAAHTAVWSGNYTEYLGDGGRGSLKSTFAATEHILLIMRVPDIHGIVLRKVANTIVTSVWPEYNRVIDRMGIRHLWKQTKKPYTLEYLPTGQTIQFYGLDDPGKLKSLAAPFGYFGVAHFEEFDQYDGEEEIRNVEQSVFRGGPFAFAFKTFNSPAMARHWVNRYKREPKPRQFRHHTTYLTTPADWLGPKFFDEAEVLKQRDPIAYAHEYLGEVVGCGTQVFDNLEIREISREEISQFDRTYCGLDWGWYPDAWAYNRVQYDAARRTLYIYDELTRWRTANRDTAHLLLARGVGTETGGPLTADSAEPKSCGDYRAEGLPCREAVKGPGSVNQSMKWLQSLAAICIDPKRCPDTAREFGEYEYEVGKDGQVLPGYPDADNHHIDAVRYATNRLWTRRGT